MKKETVFFLVGALAVTAVPQAFAADPSATIRRVCEKCHGADGNGDSQFFPSIGGQPEAYLKHQLTSFRDRARTDAHARAFMWGIARPLTDQEIDELAYYLSTRKPPKPTPVEHPELAARGKEIFEKGAPDRSVPACASCHGPEGAGAGENPRLAGQHIYYLYHRILDFREPRLRSYVKHDETKNLTDEEALAVSEYIASK